MKNHEKNFGKYEKQIAKLERLTQLALKHPIFYMEAMKKAEDELCRMIEKDKEKDRKKDEKDIQRNAA